jgi:hypothetical protein
MRRPWRQGWVDWSLHFVDSTIVRAHQHAAGARKAGGDIDGSVDEALGRGGVTIHIRAEGLGKPVTFTLTGGQVHDSQQFATLMGTGRIRRLGRGRPRLKPDRVAGDKAYSSRAIRESLRKRGIGAVIPTKSNERPPSTARHIVSVTGSNG